MWRYLAILVLSSILSACALDKSDPKNTNAASTPVTKNPVLVDAKKQEARTLDWEVENSAVAQLNSVGQSLAHRLVQASREDLLKKLVAKSDFSAMNVADKNGRLPLHFARTRAIAALLWNVDIVAYDSRHRKVRITAATYKDNDGNIPLHLMAWRSDYDAAAFASEKLCPTEVSWYDDIFINAQNNQKQSVLHLAMFNGDQKTLLALLNCRYLDLNESDLFGHTPLHLAARLEDPEPTALLLERLGNTDLRSNALAARDLIDDTPLHIAYRCSSRDTQWALLHAGAAPDAVNKFTGQKPAQASIADYHQTLTNSFCGKTMASPALQ